LCQTPLTAEYEKAGSDLIALTQVTTSHAVYISSSPTLANMISHSPAANLKPTSMYRYQAVNMFGLQIVSTQTGPEHRRHKNVAKGCFKESIMREVWDKMAEACETMIEEEHLNNGGLMQGVKQCMVKVRL
jgi:cytochrome P450